MGRPVDLDGEHAWLRAVRATGPQVRDGWIEAEADRIGGVVQDTADDAGLLPDATALDGSRFRSANVIPEIWDFYGHTSLWRMEAWCQWSPVFAVPGAVISRLFGRRLDQLALPVRPLDVAYGMDSRVVPIRAADGSQHAAGWLRTLRSTGTYVFSGCYGVRTLPGTDQPSVHVTFPLELGNVQVFLRPVAGKDGSLRLVSPPGGFGRDGAYVVVQHRGRDFAARVPLHEVFHLFTDDDAVLRTDHDLRFAGLPALKLHYKLTGR